MSFEFLMKFSKTGIAYGSAPVTIFQPGKVMEAKIVYAQASLTIPSALTTGDSVSIVNIDENGNQDSVYCATASETAAATYYCDGDVTPESKVTSHTQWAAYPRVYYPSEISLLPPSESGDTASYYVVLLCREMQGGQ